MKRWKIRGYRRRAGAARGIALALCLTLAAQLAWIVPSAVKAAEGTDRTALYVDEGGPIEGMLKIEIKQNGVLIEPNTPLPDPEGNIDVTVYLDKIPVLGDNDDPESPTIPYIQKGDFGALLCHRILSFQSQ